MSPESEIPAREARVADLDGHEEHLCRAYLKDNIFLPD